MGYYPKGGVIMNKYESVIIIDPNLTDEAIKGLIKKFSDLINTDGNVTSVDELGKKKLSYEIKKNKEGYYVVLKFEAGPNLIAELERNYRITDEIIKFIVIKDEEK
jgi:small subunit ribosomal protein S6